MLPQTIGRYVVHEQLGRGGTGVVARAWDQGAERWVAIKSLHLDQLSAARRRRLRDEAAIAATLDHPAIARILATLTIGGRDYIVMELVEGRPLTELLTDGGLGVELAAVLAVQIADGLHAAHQARLVHGDLKPDNIMVVGERRVKILDFGLAANLADDDGARPGDGARAVVGTARAMSPEQATGRPIDHRSDLFSLGSLLYEMLTGHHPFAAGDPFQTMHSVVFYDPPPVHHLQPAIPEALSSLVATLLDKHPAARPDDAATVAALLRSFTCAV